MKEILERSATVLFTGDSITDAGRRDSAIPLGAGYVRMVADLVTAGRPGHGVRFVNTGIAGNSVEDLDTRLEDDVLRHRPDVVSVLVGINDVHRHLCGQAGGVGGAGPERYAELYARLVGRVRAALPEARLVLVEPFHASLDLDSDSYRARVHRALAGYRATVRRLAGEHGALFVETQEFFLEVFRHHGIDRFFGDTSHPNNAGHLLLARRWMDAVGG